MLEEGGFVFKTNHPRLFDSGVQEVIPGALGGSDGRLAIDLAGTVILLAKVNNVVSVVLN